MGPRMLLDATIGFIRLAFATRFRLRGRYWRWRHETAFGTDPVRHPSRGEMIRLAIHYAAWTTRMRRLRR
ncbi:MAG: hypothetical protein MK082_00520 [Phycisphaerales bacterium]|nr:hypothetical protein [Phycisphaerales bacterium]